MKKVEIAGEDLQFTPVHDPVTKPLTGELIARLAGAKNPKDFIVIQWSENEKVLETLRLDEEAKFEGDAELRFIVFSGSSTYIFEIDGHRLEWGAPKIRGDVLKKLIGVDPTQFGVWQQFNDGDDKLIDNDKFADLKDDAREVFFTAKKESTEGFVP